METDFAMKERIAIGMLGLALAGCTHSRSASPVASRPVGMDPIPSIHDSINRGMGDASLQKATLSDVRHPKWSGKYAPARDDRTLGPNAGAPAGPAPAVASTTAASLNRPGTPAVLATPSSPPPDSEARAANPAELAVAPGPAPAGGAASAGELPVVEETGPGAAPAGLPPVTEPPKSAAPAAPPDVNHAPAPAADPGVAPAAAPSPAVDPLLGPNPELMPSIDAPLARPAAEPVQPAAGTPAELPLEGAPALPADPQPAQGPLPGRSPSPAPVPAPAPAAPPATSASRDEGQVDPKIKLASYNNASAMDQAIDREWREAGRSAARVGNEVITLHDLVLNVKEQLQRNPPGRSLSREELNMVAKSVLSGLIERTLIVQEAKRVLKNPKQIQRLQEAADKYWHEEELPPMMRKYAVETEYQLSQKLKESGRSLESLRQTYHQEFVAQVYLEQKFSDRRKVELPEMLAYYQQHLKDRDFQRAASITWRELVVEKDRHPAPGEARRVADQLLARVRRGEDFATLARTVSEGPTRIRQEGGLMQTSPGSYGVEAVNQALVGLPLGQTSAVLEGPSSLHIVRVEARREAGPATFEEIQDQIRRRILIQKMTKARLDFLAKLRRDTLVSTIFDGTDSDPARPQDD